jgi:dopamine D2-like receptor
VTQPIKYAKHKNNRRVWLTIALVWVISAAIGSPIVLGLNNTPNRLPDLCLFYNSDFIIYSSLSSFYIPCIIMVFLYYNIFKVSVLPQRSFWAVEVNITCCCPEADAYPSLRSVL